MANCKITVGSDSYRPWEKYSREMLEYTCVEMGIPARNLHQYSKEELFKKLVSLGCAKSAMGEEE